MSCISFLLEGAQYHIQAYKVMQSGTISNDVYSLMTEGENSYNRASIEIQKQNIEIGFARNLYSLDQFQVSSKSDNLSTLPSLQQKNYSYQFKKEHSKFSSKEIKKNQISRILSQKQNLFNLKSNQELVLKMIKKSQYDTILKNHKNGKWIDPKFHRKNQIKLFSNNKFITYSLRWENIDYISNQPYISGKKMVFISNIIQPTDIHQGLVGDCYFLASLAALAKKPERILRLFSSFNLIQRGIYMAKLVFKGILQEVVVDEYFPIGIQIKDNNSKDNNQQDKQRLISCHPGRKKNEIYTMILEKCWAKLWNSYDKIDGGLPHEALHALTGAITRNYILDDYAIKNQNNQKNQKFFNKLLRFYKSNFVMTVASFDQSDKSKSMMQIICKDSKKQINIASAHIYCIEQICVEDDIKMVKIYNPWGYNLFGGTNQKISGQIKLTWDQFIPKFHYVTVCKIFDNAHYLYHEMNFIPNKFKFIQLVIHEKKSGYVGIALSQTDKKQENYYNQYLNVTYIVLKDCEDGNFQYLTSITQSRFSDHYLQLINLERGKYIIAIYITDNQIKQQLTFCVYSEDTFGFSEKSVDKNFEQKFLWKFFSVYQQKNIQKVQKKAIDDKKTSWTTFNMMIDKSCLGYYLLRVGKQEKNKCQIKFGKQQLLDAGIVAFSPYNGQNFKLSANPGSETILPLIIIDYKKYKNWNMKKTKNIGSLPKFV